MTTADNEFTFAGSFIDDHIARLYTYDRGNGIYRHVDLEGSTLTPTRQTRTRSSYLMTDRAVREAIEDAYYHAEFEEGGARTSAQAFVRVMHAKLGARFQHPEGATWINRAKGY